MKLLAIDIGNSKIAAALLEDGRVVHKLVGGQESGPKGAEARTAEVYDWCTQLLRLESATGEIAAAAVASVVPSALELWKHLWQGKAATRGVSLIVVDSDLALPFRVAVRHPETVGADRLCNVAGAQALGFHRALVLDLGTANTFDVLWDDVFEGGLIAPGCWAAHQALLAAGAQLPDLPFGPPSDLIGRDTAEAITSGSFHQMLGGIAHVVYWLWDRYPDAPILLTGGMAEVVGPDLPVSALYHPELTLEGAAHVAALVLGGVPPANS